MVYSDLSFGDFCMTTIHWQLKRLSNVKRTVPCTEQLLPSFLRRQAETSEPRPADQAITAEKMF